MQTLAELSAMYRSLERTQILSVYVRPTAANPADGHAWQTELRHSIDRLRAHAALSGHADVAALNAALEHLSREIAELSRIHPPGWVAFISSDGTHMAAPLCVPVTTRAEWMPGILVSPYIRVIREARPAALAVVDARKASVFTYASGQLEHVDTLHAHHPVMEPSHMGDAPRLGFHAGARGSTGHDQAQRSMAVGTHRMLEETAARMRQLAGDDGWLVTGGIPALARALAEMLAALQPRVMHADHLDVHATTSDLLEAVRASVNALRGTEDDRCVASIAEGASTRGLGTLDGRTTRHALEQQCVRELCFTPRFLADHPDDTETLVRLALSESANVREVSGRGASRLDALGGVGAQLRYRVSTTVPTGSHAYSDMG